jgi:signal transduction protein with GAF and PtsI domain
MQVRAIISAALELAAEGCEVVPHILVPMICTSHEVEACVQLINTIAAQVFILPHSNRASALPQ